MLSGVPQGSAAVDVQGSAVDGPISIGKIFADDKSDV